jgi:hypothetical protein
MTLGFQLKYPNQNIQPWHLLFVHFTGKGRLIRAPGKPGPLFSGARRFWQKA